MTVRETLYLLTVHPKLIFWGALNKALMVLKNRSYQTQCCAQVVPSPLALTPQIDFYLHFQESTYNVLWIVIGLKSASLNSHRSPKSTQNYFRNCVLYAISQKLDEKFGEKAGNQVCFDGIHQFYKYSFFLHATCFFTRKNCTAISRSLFFPWKTSDSLYLLKMIIRVAFFSNTFTKP